MDFITFPVKSSIHHFSINIQTWNLNATFDSSPTQPASLPLFLSGPRTCHKLGLGLAASQLDTQGNPHSSLCPQPPSIDLQYISHITTNLTFPPASFHHVIILFKNLQQQFNILINKVQTFKVSQIQTSTTTLPYVNPMAKPKWSIHCAP